MRLNDEKKSLVKIGDFIVFTNNETGEQIKCEVMAIYHYQNFEELYKNHCKTRLGYRENEVADPKDMLKYYSQERIDKYGVLGFQIRIVL
ncbi:MAG: RNA-binding protein, partial [Bacilli bacterium]|nr:RNA-binding protein [Bacilli bacterium]